jgi:hypothetical protein
MDGKDMVGREEGKLCIGGKVKEEGVGGEKWLYFRWKRGRKVNVLVEGL